MNVCHRRAEVVRLALAMKKVDYDETTVDRAEMVRGSIFNSDEWDHRDLGYRMYTGI